MHCIYEGLLRCKCVYSKFLRVPFLVWKPAEARDALLWVPVAAKSFEHMTYTQLLRNLCMKLHIWGKKSLEIGDSSKPPLWHCTPEKWRPMSPQCWWCQQRLPELKFSPSAWSDCSSGFLFFFSSTLFPKSVSSPSSFYVLPESFYAEVNRDCFSSLQQRSLTSAVIFGINWS